MLLSILWWMLIGLIAGAIARLLVRRGPEGMGLIMTMALGMAGSLLGGLISWAFTPPGPDRVFEPAGLLLSILGAVIVLAIYVMMNAPRRRV